MFKVPESKRIRQGGMGTDESDGNNGCFQAIIRGNLFLIIASDGAGWEHVSVSLPKRCPTWEEMCAIKNLFWGEDDCVIQYHPAKKDYVNNHLYCLHLWRPTNASIPTPSTELVGVK